VVELARLRGVAVDDVARAVEANVARLLENDPWLGETYDKFFAPASE